MTDFSGSVKQPPPLSPHDEFEALNWETHSNASIETDPEHPRLVIHAKVYALAEKYGINGLKALARRKFASQVGHHFSSEELPFAIQEVYESTVEADRGLRDIVVQTFRTHPEIARRRDIGDVVRGTPDLAFELFKVGWGLPVHG